MHRLDLPTPLDPAFHTHIINENVDVRFCCLHVESLGPLLSTERTSKTDQIMWIPRLI